MGAAWSDIKREAIMVSMSLCSYISFAIKYNELKTVKVCRAMTSSIPQPFLSVILSFDIHNLR